MVLCSFPVFSYEWSGPYTIQAIEHIALGGGKSHLAIYVNEEVKTSCESANQKKAFIYTEQGRPSSWNGPWLMLASSAQALGSKVKLYLTGTCESHGAVMFGLRVIKE